jgi:hypothetical protein
MMRKFLYDLVIGVALASLVIIVMLFTAFDSSFIYRGF